MDILQQLSTSNKIRTKESFGHGIFEWTATDWACATAGEVGELCNVIKKMHRGDNGIMFEDIADEAADVVIYLDILCQRLGIDLREAIVNKFNKKSDKVGSLIKLHL